MRPVVLALDRNVAASTQTVALSTLLFLYRQVLQIELLYIDEIERAKRPERLPVVFTRVEVKQILAHLDGVHHLSTSLLYGSGLRLMECLRLRVKDIDFEYRQITVVMARATKTASPCCRAQRLSHSSCSCKKRRACINKT